MNWILQPDNPTIPTDGGGKALHLQRVSQLGYPVPEWFCISSRAFNDFVLSKLPAADSQNESEIFTHLRGEKLPPEWIDGLRTELVRRGWNHARLAVRSSAIGEDSQGNSFAGLFTTELNQQGSDQVLEAILRCWASAFSDRARAYRKVRKIDATSMAVVIQRMINPEVAGVAFSVHPQDPLQQSLLIESVWGLGESLVSGEVEADRFRISRDLGSVDCEPAEHLQRRIGISSGGTRLEDLPSDLKEKVTLTDQQAKDVARLVLKLEKDFGRPQDCEWGLENGKLYCLQTRPITAQAGGQPRIWDNSNIIESYCGVTTPLTFSHVNRCYREVYFQFCRYMGLDEKTLIDHDPMFRNMLGLIQGRIYYNLVNWYRMLALFPLFSQSRGFMETMMGVRESMTPELAKLFEFQSRPVSAVRRIRIILHILRSLVGLKKLNHEFLELIDHEYRPIEAMDLTRLSMQELLDLYNGLSDRVLARWLAPIANDTSCMVWFGVLKSLTTKWVGAEESLQNDLLCGEGDVKSTEPTKLLMKLAAKIRAQGGETLKTFESLSSEEVLKQMRESFAPAIWAEFQDFIRAYGFRCVNELKLEECDLRDNPRPAVETIQGYLRSPGISVEQMERREREIRSNAEARVRDTLSGIKRWVYFRVLILARRSVRDRELLRFERSRTFGTTRLIFRCFGARLQERGALTEASDVFYLTIEELIAFIEGRSTSVQLAGTAALRKEEFESYRKLPSPPDRFVTRGEVGFAILNPDLIIASDLTSKRADPLEAGTFIGTPCCPGVVEAPVRVAQSYSEAEGIRGEILVTERTDPGWVPLFPTCAGLIIERGSLLSHSAVVARELGVPTIVGVRGKPMLNLKTGQRVKMDAAKGEVKTL